MLKNQQKFDLFSILKKMVNIKREKNTIFNIKPSQIYNRNNNVNIH